MDRLKEFARSMAEVAKLVAMVATAFGACYGAARLYAYAASRADATEVAVLKSKHADDHEILMYIAHRIDDMAAQFNHQALTGKVPYVPPPPAPPEVLGPQLPTIKGNAP